MGGGIRASKDLEGQQPRVAVAQRRPEDVGDLGQGVCKGEITGCLGGFGQDEIEDDGTGAQIVDTCYQAGEEVAGPGKGAALGDSVVVYEDRHDRRLGPGPEARRPQQ